MEINIKEINRLFLQLVDQGEYFMYFKEQNFYKSIIKRVLLVLFYRCENGDRESLIELFKLIQLLSEGIRI